MLEGIAGLVGVRGYCCDEKELCELKGKASNNAVHRDSYPKSSDDIHVLSLLLPISLSKVNRSRLLLDTSEILCFGRTVTAAHSGEIAFLQGPPLHPGGRVERLR